MHEQIYELLKHRRFSDRAAFMSFMQSYCKFPNHTKTNHLPAKSGNVDYCAFACDKQSVRSSKNVPSPIIWSLGSLSLKGSVLLSHKGSMGKFFFNPLTSSTTRKSLKETSMKLKAVMLTGIAVVATHKQCQYVRTQQCDPSFLLWQRPLWKRNLTSKSSVLKTPQAGKLRNKKLPADLQLLLILPSMHIFYSVECCKLIIQIPLK